jgi:hypothetical protein
MKFCNRLDTLSLAVKQQSQYAVYVECHLEFDDSGAKIWNFVRSEVEKLQLKNLSCLVMGDILDGGLFFFDNECEAREFYSIFEQPLTYSSDLYAALYSDDGQCLTENT